MKRRHFLISGASFGALLLTGSCSNVLRKKPTVGSNPNFLLGNDANLGQITLYHRDGVPYYFTGPLKDTSKLLITSADGFNEIDVPNFSHSINISPRNPGLVVGTPKGDRPLYSADWKNKTLLKVFQKEKEEVYYGHSVFTTDGSFVFTTTRNFKMAETYISVHNFDTGNLVRKIRIKGGPHQLKWHVPDKTLAVVESGYSQSRNSTVLVTALTHIDVQSGNRINEFLLSQSSFSHFSMTTDQKEALCFRIATRDKSPVLAERISLIDRKLYTAPLNFKKTSVTSSGEAAEAINHIIFEDKNLALISGRIINTVYWWDYKNNVSLHEHKFDTPIMGLNLLPGGKQIAISFIPVSKQDFINVYDTNDFLNKKLTLVTSFKGGRGHHVTVV